jgi:hypothetical protein
VAQLLPLPQAGRPPQVSSGAVTRVPVELMVRGTCAPPLKSKAILQTTARNGVRALPKKGATP